MIQWPEWEVDIQEVEWVAAQLILHQDRFKYQLRKWRLLIISYHLVSQRKGQLKLSSLVIKMKKWLQISYLKLEQWMKTKQLKMQSLPHKLRTLIQEELILNQKVKMLLFRKCLLKSLKQREVKPKRTQINQNQIIVIMMIRRMKVEVMAVPQEEKVAVKDHH